MLKDLSLCRRFEVTWPELQQMPEETVLVLDAILTGEERARSAKAAMGS